MSILKYTTIKYTKWILIILISLCWISIYFDAFAGDDFSFEHAVGETGELAWYLLIFTIFISLVHKLLPRVAIFCNLLPLRKYTGIFAFLIAGSHAVTELIKRGITTDIPAIFSTVFSTQYAMVFGSIGFLAMLPAFLTSSNWIVARMKYKTWKRIQRVAHIAFIFAALHIGLLRYFYNGTIEWGPFILLGLYVLGYGFLWGKIMISSHRTCS